MNYKEKELVTEEFCKRDDTYNICPGGDGGFGYINNNGLSGAKLGSLNALSQNSKDKRSQSLISYYKNNKMTDEHKKNIGKGTLGNKSWTGRKHSEETKRKISEAIRKRKAS